MIPEPDEVEQAVIEMVLRRHPAQLTADELARAVGRPPILVHDAVGELVADGLLNRHGDFVVPTRAAVRFAELL